MRVITWNCRRAHAQSKIWAYLSDLAPDIALLQEVTAIPEHIRDDFAIRQMHPVTKYGTPQKFSTAILARGSIGKTIPLRASSPWVNTELARFSGNFVAVEAKPARGPHVNIICVYSPAWPIDKARLIGFDVTGIRLTQNPDVWPADLLWAALTLITPQPSDAWLIGGDFNLSETFDSWPGGPRGNREYLDRLDQLGLVDCLRHKKGALTPTFRTLRSGTITAQLDYLFVTEFLRSRLVGCATGSEQQVFEGGLSDHLPVMADFTSDATPPWASSVVEPVRDRVPAPLKPPPHLPKPERGGAPRIRVPSIKLAASEQDAREFVESRMPDVTIRRRYLSILADAIEEVNRFANNQWAVTVTDRLRLVIGHYYTYTLWSDEVVWLALDTENYLASIRPGQPIHESLLLGWKADGPKEYPHYTDRKLQPFSTNGYYNLRAADPTVWPMFEKLSFSFIAKAIAIGQPLYSTSRTAHAPGVLEYMRKDLNTAIPDPQY
jgi:exonuclease III